jgi:hypothetical protein
VRLATDVDGQPAVLNPTFEPATDADDMDTLTSTLDAELPSTATGHAEG